MEKMYEVLSQISGKNMLFGWKSGMYPYVEQKKGEGGKRQLHGNFALMSLSPAKKWCCTVQWEGWKGQKKRWLLLIFNCITRTCPLCLTLLVIFLEERLFWKKNPTWFVKSGSVRVCLHYVTHGSLITINNGLGPFKTKSGRGILGRELGGGDMLGRDFCLEGS